MMLFFVLVFLIRCNSSSFSLYYDDALLLFCLTRPTAIIIATAISIRIATAISIRIATTISIATTTTTTTTVMEQSLLLLCCCCSQNIQW